MSTPTTYSEASVSGVTWRRCHQVVLENPRQGQRVIRFDEEDLLQLDGGREIRTDAGTLPLAFDPAATFELIDPVTGEPLGQTASHAQAYTLIYSAYRAAAAARDAQQQPTPADAATQYPTLPE